ncbi:hypothetical protein PORCRE_986 [Porphyromonas crevioricanis JCM 15906]|uniref:Membrane-bound lytic transglycosylase F n=2 Tax=Porphyromonas crevioricanis TaxID=393921 RepID=A0A2X4PLG6_9PORP|nr:transporter substrate-binding domain-containing protein [Porphyromonas crevioricanis]GAD05286.1 hypothetical protein PORCRE_986 [Porphyromonas crevioricanis JCM 15906]GAD06636.1 hypothetical protein PORCAN_234 [Porphyromonas crevioricanis JCM 13913]SJZ52531.1 extracellular solute-binding protein, family 3 [Porphyromonas crevioricanis]SQH73215.1 membrane-bound lytic transglycosylase F [Porphyromonas crevioricanis]
MKRRYRGKPLSFILYLGLLLAVLLCMFFIGHRIKSVKESVESDCIERDYEQIAERGELNILTAYDGLNYSIEGDSTVGAVYRVARELRQISGWQVNVLLAGSWAESLADLCSGRVDVIAMPVAQTTQIDSTRYRYLEPIHHGLLYLVKRKDRSASDRLGQGIDSVVLPRASSVGIVLRHLSEETGNNFRIVEDPVYGSEQLAIRVAEGNIAATICSDWEVSRLIRLLPEIDCSVPISVGLRQGWVLRHSSICLADSLNSWLMRILTERKRKEDNFNN